MNYDEWFKSLNQNGRETYFLGQEGTISKESWNYQQAKIDELQARIATTEAWIEANKKAIALSEWHGYTTEEYVDADDLLGILKGNKDEN